MHRFFAGAGPPSYDPGVTRSAIAMLVLLSATPASAQRLRVAEPTDPSAGRPVGEYAGVEPGQAAPPPALDRAARRRQARPRPATIVTWPGFQPLPGGGSRFFVQKTDPVRPEVRLEQGRVVLLFRNTQVHLSNSTRWLETRFFDTPVVRARLERRGRDMAFVLYLRAPAEPSVSMEPSPDGTFHYVYVDFPPGSYAEPSEGRQLAPAAGPPPSPARPEDSTLRALDEERPPAQEPSR